MFLFSDVFLRVIVVIAETPYCPGWGDKGQNSQPFFQRLYIELGSFENKENNQNSVRYQPQIFWSFSVLPVCHGQT